ncbi:unnamed protein product [Phyllotreta striolata]|uniref:Lipase domain-containing protein n=1 Tax=Phyllotreta striolata TaxID=444603 RepID=A0A9N9TJT3_PHYSR|nr:unnamed protein product [Phyllotreta striolata]
MIAGTKLLLFWTSCLTTVYSGIILDNIFPVNESKIKFYVYTRNDTANSVDPIDISNPDEVSQTYFNSTKPTVFCANSVFEKPFDVTNSCQRIKNAILKAHDANFIFIDWSSISNRNLYFHLLGDIEKAADIIKNKILDMIDYSELDMENSQIVGASVGAQMIGAIGTAVGGNFQQVVALDPASIYFYSFWKNINSISTKSGKHVQVIHSSAYHRYPLGHADYYMNGGLAQPYCGMDLFRLCSHARSISLYMHTIVNGARIEASKCDSLEDFYATKYTVLDVLFPIDDTKIKYYIYTQNTTDDHYEVNVVDPKDMLRAGFSKDKHTMFCLFAYNELPLEMSNTCQRIKRAVLKSHDINYVFIDWSLLSTDDLFQMLRLIEILGVKIRDKILDMIDGSGLDMNNCQIIGASLGAQVVGIIGLATGGLFRQVIGLDPTAYIFFPFYDKNRISKKSGQFVQVIHTGPGYFLPMGHADYYMNGGELQPHCPTTDWYCSHMVAVLFYLSTIINDNKPVAYKCENADRFYSGQCKNNPTSYPGGFLVDRNASGKYYFTDYTYY